MKKVKISLSELVRQNKEELVKDREKMEKIEKRIEEKYVKQR